MDAEMLAQLKSLITTEPTINQMIDAIHNSIGLDRLSIQMSQVNSSFVCIATAESFISLSCSGEGSSAREAEIKAKANLLRELTGLTVEFKEEERYSGKCMPAPTQHTTQPTKASKPAPSTGSLYKQEDSIVLATLKNLMKLTKDDQEKYFKAWSNSNGGKITKLTPENVKGFIAYLTRQAYDIFGKEEVDRALGEAKAGL